MRRLVAVVMIGCGGGGGATPQFELSQLQASISVKRRAGSAGLAVEAWFTPTVDATALDFDRHVTATYQGVAYDIPARMAPSSGTMASFGFVGTVPISGPPDGEQIIVALVGDQDQALTTLVMPDSFEILTATGSFTSQTDPLVITWQPVRTDPMSWRTIDLNNHTGACWGGSAFADTGTVTIGAGSVTFGNPLGACGIELSRLRYGIPDPAFAPGGYVVASQADTP